MPTPLTPENGIVLFSEFVENVKKTVPTAYRQNFPTIDAPDKSGEAWVREAWDRLGKSYIYTESTDAFGVTMYALLKHLRFQGQGRERWLSLGSGPGLYEIFLAGIVPSLEITSQDLSTKQIEIQKELITSYSRRNPNLQKRIKTVRGSMKDLQKSNIGRDFNQVLLINSLQWTDDWKGTISAVNQVLTPNEGARVNLVLSSATVLSSQGRKNQGIDSDQLVDEFEKYHLRAQVIGHLNVISGQLGLPTSRFFAVFERDSTPRAHWSQRGYTGDLGIIEYTINDGIIVARDTKLSGN